MKKSHYGSLVIIVKVLSVADEDIFKRATDEGHLEEPTIGAMRWLESQLKSYGGPRLDSLFVTVEVR